jgi:hypothetical protein
MWARRSVVERPDDALSPAVPASPAVAFIHGPPHGFRRVPPKALRERWHNRARLRLSSGWGANPHRRAGPRHDNGRLDVGPFLYEDPAWIAGVLTRAPPPFADLLGGLTVKRGAELDAA